jgi:hypothetical protein
LNFLAHIFRVLQGFTLYSELAGWTPTLQDIQAIALVISNDFATVTAARKAQSAGDDWMAHSIYFIRDSLFFMLFEKAVSFADAGQLIRILKYWGLAFRGVGQHNYARECAEVLVHWRYELTDKLRSALAICCVHCNMRDTHLQCHLEFPCFRAPAILGVRCGMR